MSIATFQSLLDGYDGDAPAALVEAAADLVGAHLRTPERQQLALAVAGSMHASSATLRRLAARAGAPVRARALTNPGLEPDDATALLASERTKSVLLAAARGCRTGRVLSVLAQPGPLARCGSELLGALLANPATPGASRCTLVRRVDEALTASAVTGASPPPQGVVREAWNRLAGDAALAGELHGQLRSALLQAAAGVHVPAGAARWDSDLGPAVQANLQDGPRVARVATLLASAHVPSRWKVQLAGLSVEVGQPGYAEVRQWLRTNAALASPGAGPEELALAELPAAELAAELRGLSWDAQERVLRRLLAVPSALTELLCQVGGPQIWARIGDLDPAAADALLPGALVAAADRAELSTWAFVLRGRDTARLAALVTALPWPVLRQLLQHERQLAALAGDLLAAVLAEPDAGAVALSLMGDWSASLPELVAAAHGVAAS